MHWEIILIPLIAFGAWVLSTLFKSEDEKAKQQPRFRPGFDPRAPRRPASALDAFLEETRKRRAAAEGMEAIPAPPPRLAKSQPIITPRRSPPPRRQVPIIATVIEEVATPLVAARVVDRPPDALLVPIPLLSPPVGVTPGLPAAIVAPRFEPPKSPLLQEVMRLLSSPKTAGTALILHEILERPAGRRR